MFSSNLKCLTHWGRVTHICVSKLTINGSDNGLDRHQAIMWTNAGILLIGPLGTNFSEILIEIHAFSFKKMHLKMSSGKWRPFCLGLNELRPKAFGNGNCCHFGTFGSYFNIRMNNMFKCCYFCIRDQNILVLRTSVWGMALLNHHIDICLSLVQGQGLDNCCHLSEKICPYFNIRVNKLL